MTEAGRTPMEKFKDMVLNFDIGVDILNFYMKETIPGIFADGQVGFTSMDDLKDHIRSGPHGEEVKARLHDLHTMAVEYRKESMASGKKESRLAAKVAKLSTLILKTLDEVKEKKKVEVEADPGEPADMLEE